jgi:hypothetical protein
MTEKKCPLLKKPCIKEQCMWSTTVRGTNPNTGAEVDQHGCAIAFLPMLLIENAQMSRETGAAVESARNVFADAVETAKKIESKG